MEGGDPVPREQQGTHGRALLILKHDLEPGRDRSRDDRGEDDGHFDGAEGANLPLCYLHSKRGGQGRSAFTFPSRRLPWPHHGRVTAGASGGSPRVCTRSPDDPVLAHTRTAPTLWLGRPCVGVSSELD